MSSVQYFLLAAVFIVLFSSAYALLPGYKYYIPITVHNPNSYPIYNYAIKADLNLSPYTEENYADIDVTYITSSEQEIPFSKVLLPNGLVRIYAFIPELQQNQSATIRVYVGNQYAQDKSLPLSQAIGKYLAITFHDGELAGDTWTPEWYQISSCSKTYWSDGGRDLFDKFLYPYITVNGVGESLRVSARSSCNPRSYTIDGIVYRSDTFAYGYAPGDSSEPHNPGAAHQRIWYQLVQPRCDYMNRDINSQYLIQGNMGVDDYAHYFAQTVNLFGTNYTIHEVTDDDTPDGTTRPHPQVHLLLLYGGNNKELFYTDYDWVDYFVEHSGKPMAISALMVMGDLHQYVAQWIQDNAELSPACYVDDPIQTTVGPATEIRDIAVTAPTTMYRGQDYNVYIYYTGSDPLTVTTDWNSTITPIQLDQNDYYATVTVPITVSPGEHTLSVEENGTVVYTTHVEVYYSGTPTIGAIEDQNLINGKPTVIMVPITCSNDDCNGIHVTFDVNGCYTPTPYYDIPFTQKNATTYVGFQVVCYHNGEYNANIYANTQFGSAHIIIPIRVSTPMPTGTVSLDGPSVADPNAILSYTISAQGYDGNVYVSIVDSNFNHVLDTEANEIQSGVFAATISLPDLPDGQYYVIASGTSFSIAKPLAISSYAFANGYGIAVLDMWNKPASIFNAKVDGNYLEYNIVLYNPRATPFTAKTDVWLQQGGIIQIPQDFTTTIDSLSVTSGSTAYSTSYSVSGGAIAVVWGNGSNNLTLQPADNHYTLRIKSPYLDYLYRLYANTNDPKILDFIHAAEDANYAYQQKQAYLEAVQYMNSAMYGGISVEVYVPPSVTQGQTATGFAYIKNSSGNIDPTSISCEEIDTNGDVIGNCTTTHVGTGAYKIDLNTSTVGVFGVRVSATAGLYVGQGIAYYSVDSAYKQGTVTVTNFVIPPNGKTTVIYAQDPAATVVVSMYSPDGTLLRSGQATYNSNIGAFTYDLNVGDVPEGDYVIVVTDNFGYSDRAIIHVSPILENIYSAVQDINTFLSDVIAPKLDNIQQKEDQILDGQHNLYSAVEDVNANVQQVINMLNLLDQNIDAQHQETVQYLQELNTTAYQILQTVQDIKQKIDNVVIVKLNQVITNQEDINGTVNDLKQMLDCNQPSAVCVQLQTIQYTLQDLNSEISTEHQETISRLDQLQDTSNTILQYVENLKQMLDCNTPYPQTNVCAKLDVLQQQAQAINGNIVDVNNFLNRIYDYVRNDLTNKVINVGNKVEDINSYLHGDIWNELVQINNNVSGLYNETNAIKTLVQNHNATVLAQLDALHNYLSDVNSTLYNKIQSVQDTLLPYLQRMDDRTTDILMDTNTLINYFGCSQPNEVCNKLNNIYSLTLDINATNNELISDVNDVKQIELANFIAISNRLEQIDSNVQDLKNTLSCDQFPDSPVCSRLSEILSDTNTIKTNLADLNAQMFDLYHAVEHQIQAVHDVAAGGGGGGPQAIPPIKVVYRAGTAYVALPEYVPDGQYTIYYTGDLYRYVEEPAPGKSIKVKGHIMQLKLSPQANGVISGRIILKQGSREFTVQTDIIANDKMNQKVNVQALDNQVTIHIPDGGAEVEFKGPIAACVNMTKRYYAHGGEYTIPTKCSAPGVVEITPLHGLNQASIQITVNQTPEIVHAGNIMQTTVIPTLAFFAFAVIISYLGLIPV